MEALTDPGQAAGLPITAQAPERKDTGNPVESTRTGTILEAPMNTSPTAMQKATPQQPPRFTPYSGASRDEKGPHTQCEQSIYNPPDKSTSLPDQRLRKLPGNSRNRRGGR